MNKRNQLPKGWEVKSLGELGKVSMCKRIFKKQTTISGEIPFYKIGTFGKTPNAFITKELYKEYRGKYSFPKKGDILLSASGTIGRRVIYDGNPAYFQDSNIVWIDNDEKEVSNEYLYLFYGFCNWNPSRGATISRLYNSDLRKIEIPFPKSFQEQQKIVELLDEAFTKIEKAKANIEKNIENAKELFQSKLNDIFSQRGEGWEEKTLIEISNEFGRGKSKHRPRNAKKLFGGKYPFVQTGNVRNSKKYITSYSQTYNEVGLAQSKLWKKGTVCITIAANIAETAILDFDASFPDSIIGLVVNPSKATNEYAYYALVYLKTELQAKGKGSAQDNLNLGTFKKQLFPFPNIEKQKSIVQVLDNLNKELTPMVKFYNQKLKNLEELKKSLLEKAFNGELTK